MGTVTVDLEFLYTQQADGEAHMNELKSTLMRKKPPQFAGHVDLITSSVVVEPHYGPKHIQTMKS